MDHEMVMLPLTCLMEILQIWCSFTVEGGYLQEAFL